MCAHSSRQQWYASTLPSAIWLPGQCWHVLHVMSSALRPASVLSGYRSPGHPRSAPLPKSASHYYSYMSASILHACISSLLPGRVSGKSRGSTCEMSLVALTVHAVPVYRHSGWHRHTGWVTPFTSLALSSHLLPQPLKHAMASHPSNEICLAMQYFDIMCSCPVDAGSTGSTGKLTATFPSACTF